MQNKQYRIILLNGPSSSGKSSLSIYLKNILKEKGLDYQIVSIDDFMKIGTDETIYEDDVFEISLDMCKQTLEYLKEYDGVIIDHVITSERIYQQLLEETRDFHVLKVHVDCPLEELIKRENQRGNRHVGSAQASFTYLYPKKGYDLVVNTLINTTQECASIIANYLLNK